MNKPIEDSQVTRSFRLYEFIEASLPVLAVKLNWKHINEFKQGEFQRLAEHLQCVRNVVNAEFRQGNGGREIGMRVTSGFRCLAWEILRGRPGTSQHTVLAAADIQPTGCPPLMAVEIIAWLNQKYGPRKTGHMGGFAIKKPTYNSQGKVVAVGFAHFDLRGYVARWEY